MPTYIATIQVRLTEDTMKEAMAVAQEVATDICDQAMTDCALVQQVEERP